MRTIFVSAALVLLVAANALAQSPAGPEFKVNTDTVGDVTRPKVASDPRGNFVVVWDASAGLSAQRFDASGVRRGGEFLVSAVATVGTFAPQVSSDASGGFVVAWGSASSTGDVDVFGRRFDSNGAPVGPDMRLNSYTTGSQSGPAVASDGAGNFVAIWNSEGQDGDARGVFGQRFDASGARLGGEFAVNASTTGTQYSASVATDGSGNFVVAWGSRPSDEESVILGQQFDASGARIGPELRVNSDTGGIHARPVVAVTPGGDFAVVWQNFSALPSRIVGRRFTAAGLPVGLEFVVHSVSLQGAASAAIDATGGLAVVWSDSNVDGDDLGVRARRFDEAGAPLGPAFQVNSATAGPQWLSAVSSDSAGNLVAVWLGPRTQSPEVHDVYAQRFGLLGAAALVVDTAAGSTSDGNQVLEPGESVDLRPSWTNNTDASQDLDGTLTTLTGPPGASYTIVDGAGEYGMVPAGATQPCLDCYRVGVSGAPRPALHWDATATELIGTGEDAQFRWPVHIGASFTDVPRTSHYYPFVETLLHRGVTAGCGATTYCPSIAATREQMAAFVLTAKETARYIYAPCSTRFADVPPTNPFCPWIEELARRGAVGGCGGGNYCPAAPVTREQMAVIVLRIQDPTLSPPACTTPVFNDVPASSPFCRWIEELARRRVVSGCGGGSYCPTQPVTREQMAVFLTGTFGLTLYGP